MKLHGAITFQTMGGGQRAEYTLCGLDTGNTYAADPESVTCAGCKRSRHWRQYVEQQKEQRK